ncbi:hypothetical protein BaRGS_00037844 [Batillaria attramentaria]|uniref:Uncharacterized protein n=1 Tax=Batillaria attramentaria TaxID=370345 RepID=A0ABD0J7R9_9CAEN
MTRFILIIRDNEKQKKKNKTWKALGTIGRLTLQRQVHGRRHMRWGWRRKMFGSDQNGKAVRKSGSRWCWHKMLAMLYWHTLMPAMLYWHTLIKATRITINRKNHSNTHTHDDAPEFSIHRVTHVPLGATAKM